MATSNFRKQNNFPLYATTFFDGFYYTDEETGEEMYFEDGICDYKTAKEDLEEFNDGLKFYRLTFEDGYYEGTQIILEDSRAVEDGYETNPIHYTAEEWKEARKNEKDSYGRYYDYKQPYSVQKRLEQQEKRKILEFINEVLKPKYDFEEYKIIGQFSNGETFYKKVA